MKFFFKGRLGRNRPFLSGPAESKKVPAEEFGLRERPTAQVYKVKRRRLYEYVELDDNPVLVDRSFIFRRWLRPVLSSLEGQVFCVHLGDAPDHQVAEGMPNFCYCKKQEDRRNLILIPDAHYQGQKGYVSQRKHRKLYKIRWDKKNAQIIFRGSCTGERPLENNVRAQLCAIDHPLLDARISRVNNGWDEEELRHLLGNEMSRFAMAQYKYQVDVDGNTNSWCAFFWKLMSGSLVFKLSSAWQQWYYPQIQTGVHFEAFSNFEELFEKVVFYKKHDDLALQIARNAQNFTRRFRFEDQYAYLLRAFQ